MSNANIGNDTGVIPVGTIVWKKCWVPRHGLSLNQAEDWGSAVGMVGVLVKLRVTEEGIVPTSSKYDFFGYEKFRRGAVQSRKCRVRAAEVLEIVPIQVWADNLRYRKDNEHFGNKKRLVARSYHDSSFVYRVGQVVRPVEEFDATAFEICRSGIHCFRTKCEAARYNG